MSVGVFSLVQICSAQGLYNLLKSKTCLHMLVLPLLIKEAWKQPGFVGCFFFFLP